MTTDDRAEFTGLPEVLAVVAELAEAFVAEGHRLYLVGGVVRDLALGSQSAGDDIDLTTDAEPAVVKRLVKPRATALWSQGERFGTIGATINGRDLEITTHRAEAYDHGSRNPVVAFGTSIDDDLVRRDFTINAMAVSLPDCGLVDPFSGLDDLARRVLVTPLSPEESFGDDPLRMLRAARFLPRFGLSVDPAVEEAATRLASRLVIVSVERVQGELERLLSVDEPGVGLDFLTRTGLLGQVITAYAPGSSGEAGESGEAREAAESAARAVAVASRATTVAARRAGLFLPLGTDAKVELRRLRYSRARTAQTLDLIAAHAVAVSASPSAADVRRVVADIGTEAMVDLRALTDATHPASVALSFWAVHEDLARTEDLGDLASPLSGGEIMRYLGLPAGPEVGEATRHLHRVRIEQGPLSDAEARAALEAWAGEHAARQEAEEHRG